VPTRETHAPSALSSWYCRIMNWHHQWQVPSGACNLFQMSCHFSMKTLLERYKISNEYQDLKKNTIISFRRNDWTKLKND